MYKTRNTKCSKQRRIRRKFEAEETDYNSYLDKYCRLQKERSTHPLFLCSSQEFNTLKENTILIGNPRISDNHRPNRKIYYDILSIGANIRYVDRGKRMILNLRNTKKMQFS